MKILENPRKLKSSANLLLLYVKITQFLEFSKKITIKAIVFSNSGEAHAALTGAAGRQSGTGGANESTLAAHFAHAGR